MPKLLGLLNVKGHIVSADAIHCQVKTAEKILEREGDYLLGLKGNQEYLKEFKKMSKLYPEFVKRMEERGAILGHLVAVLSQFIKKLGLEGELLLTLSEADKFTYKFFRKVWTIPQEELNKIFGDLI